MTSEGSNRTNHEWTTSRILGWLIAAAVGIGLGFFLPMPTGDKCKGSYESQSLTPAEITRREAIVSAIRSAKPGDFIITLNSGIFAIREIHKETVYFYRSRFASGYDFDSITDLVSQVVRVVTYDDDDYKKLAKYYIRGRPLVSSGDLSNQADPCQD